MASNVQIIGLIRFSVLTSNTRKGWRLGGLASEEEYGAQLFDDRRLARRFEAFEAVTVPGFDGQTDRDFAVAVMTSTRLPEPWRARLDALARERPFLSVMAFEPTGRVRDIAQTAVRRLRRPGDRIATFRLDDDDALAQGFVASLRRNASEVADGTVVSFPSGIFVRAAPGGSFEVMPVTKPAIAVGLSLVADAEGDTSIFHKGNHNKIDPSGIVMDTQPGLAWFKSYNDQNDSRLDKTRDVFRRRKYRRSRRVLDAGEVRALLADAFPTLRPDAVWRALAPA